MSLQVSIGDFHQDITYNYSTMLYATGMCRWRMMNGVPGAFVGWIFEATLEELERDRPRFELMIKGDGEWGNWQHIIVVLTALVLACRDHPRDLLRIT